MSTDIFQTGSEQLRNSVEKNKKKQTRVNCSAGCTKRLTLKELDFSMGRYGKPVCFNCQKNYTYHQIRAKKRR